MTQTTLNAYLAARQGAAFYWPLSPGFLVLAGEDRLDFLQRQTTNDLRLLGPGRSLQTVLTSPTARILDVLIVFEWEGGLGIITLPGRVQRTARDLRGKIFFMDRVTVSDASATVVQVDLEGPQAAAMLARLGLAVAPGPDQTAAFDLDGAPVQVIAHPGLCGAGYRLLAAIDRAEALPAALSAAGAAPLDAHSYELLRIEAGLPGPDGELTDAYNPLEVGLEGLISERKGCYTGQEIIARQISYDKVTRKLVGLRLASPAAVGTKLELDAKQVGEITSAAVSPRLGPLALAVVKRPHSELGAMLVAAPKDSDAISAVVAALPF